MSKITLSRDEFESFWEATIRYYELDPQGVMHNANHVAFFDQAITAYFKHINYDYLKEIHETKKDFHTVQVLVQYNKPLYFDQSKGVCCTELRPVQCENLFLSLRCRSNIHNLHA